MTPRYQEHAPGEALADAVECLWTGTVTAEQARTGCLVMPDGCVDIVFWPEGGLRAVGTMTTAQQMIMPEGATVTGIRFRPGVARAFLGWSPAEFIDASPALDDLWGSRSDRLRNELLNCREVADQISTMRAAVGTPDAYADPVRRAVRAIENAQGDIDLDWVATQANLSPRQFRRRCLEETGLTPKHLCRILRFRRALRAMHSARDLRWADIAAESGYYDQAHLIHEFREFSGLTPSAYEQHSTMAEFSNTAG